MDDLTRAFRNNLFVEQRQLAREKNAIRDEFENEVLDMRLASLTLDNSPANHELSDKLDRVIFVSKCQQDETCGVCLSSVHNKKTKITPCGHYFHSQCLSRWTNDKKQRSCPNCREDLFPFDQRRNRGPEIEIEEFVSPLAIPNSGNSVEESASFEGTESTETIYPSDSDSIPSDVYDLPTPWDMEENSPILMLPEHPHPSRCLEVLEKISKSEFVLPVDELSYSELYQSVFNSAHLPSIWRRRTFQYVECYEDQWLIRDISKIEWEGGPITLQTEGSNACADTIADYLHSSRIWTRPEVLVRQRENGAVIDILELWIPELIGGLPSRRGGIVIDHPTSCIASLEYSRDLLRPSIYSDELELPLHWVDVKSRIVRESQRYAMDTLNVACTLLENDLPITPNLWSGI